MPYKNFLKFFRKADVAITQNFQHVVKEFKPSSRQTRMLVDNPEDQSLYIVGEMISDRMLPRAQKCKQNNNVVLYFEKQSGGPVDPA